MAPKNLVLHRLDVHNVGDLASNPMWYIPALVNFFPADLTTVDLAAFDELETVVVGGGGLLRPEGNGWYADRWRRILTQLGSDRRPRLLVLWGVGHIDNRDRPFTLSEFCTTGDLVGIRDRVDGVPFVPCASALHPFFDAVPDPTTEVAVFHCADRPLAYRDFPSLSNDSMDVAAALAHCASGQLLITNSYHGWYWGTLAKRRVLLVNPRTTKFDALPWSADHLEVNPGSLDSVSLDSMNLAGRGLAHPDALSEARDRNQEFAQRVLARMEAH